MQDYTFLKQIERRDFLKIVSFTGLAGLIYPRDLISSLVDTQTRVVVIEDSKSTSSGNKIDKNIVQIMIDEGIKQLTNINDTGEAWKSLFPGINGSSVIAIKVNCINSSQSTHPEVSYAIANSMKKMNFGGNLFPENNVIIFDRTTNELKNASSGTQNMKYTINTAKTGIRCFGTDSTGVGYNTQNYDVYGSSQRISKIVADTSNFMVNAAVLKNWQGGAGVTLCMKNHYGTINSPGNLHADFDRQIAVLNTLAPIATKQKLFIIDALFGVITGGPGNAPQVNPKKIIMGTDIVAVDTIGRQLLKDKGCTTTESAGHIEVASTVYNLGTNDPARIETINIKDPSINYSVNDDSFQANLVLLEQNYPNPFSESTQIRFYLNSSSNVELSVFDMNGKAINTIINAGLDSGWHNFTWNGSDKNNQQVPSGIYICSLKAGSANKSIILQISR